MEVLRRNANHAILHRVLRTHGSKRLEMLVNGAGAKVAATRHGNLSRTEPAQQCAEKIIAGAHLAGKLVGNFGTVDMGGVDLVNVAADHADAGAQLAEDLERGHHIADTGQIFDDALALGQNGGGQDGHRSVFGAANDHIPVQGLASPNHKLFQNKLSFESPQGRPRHGLSFFTLAEEGACKRLHSHAPVYYTSFSLL